MNVLRLMILAFGALCFFSGCNYVPKGSTVFEFKSKTEFERAYLSPEGHDENNHQRIDMRWYGTNKFLTTGTLEPGPYHFVARTYQGSFFSANVNITSDKDFYELTQSTTVAASQSSHAAKEMTLTASLPAEEVSRRVPRLAVVFIGDEVVVRNATPNSRGQFSVPAPSGQHW